MYKRQVYDQGLVRVAAATLTTGLVRPADNAAAVLEVARACAAEGVGVVVFPELTLTGYSLEDLVLQDALLDAVEAGLAQVVEASRELLPVLVVGAPLRARQRVYNLSLIHI